MGHLRREGERPAEPIPKYAAEITLVIRADDPDTAEEVVAEVLSAIEVVPGVQLATSKRVSRL
jgi:2-keto-4-pentenoate hydratase